MLDNLQLLFVWAPIINIQIILEGIFVGAVFALSAYGLALVWGVMNIKNLAQGDFVIMGGYLALALSSASVPLPFIVLIVTSVMFVFGWCVYVVMIKRIIDQDMFVSLLATFGLSLLLQQVMNLIFGPEVETIDMQLPVYDAFDNPVVKNHFFGNGRHYCSLCCAVYEEIPHRSGHSGDSTRCARR